MLLGDPEGPDKIPEGARPFTQFNERFMQWLRELHPGRCRRRARRRSRRRRSFPTSRLQKRHWSVNPRGARTAADSSEGSYCCPSHQSTGPSFAERDSGKRISSAAGGWTGSRCVPHREPRRSGSGYCDYEARERPAARSFLRQRPDRLQSLRSFSAWRGIPLHVRPACNDPVRNQSEDFHQR